MKTKILSIVAIFAMSFVMTAQIDRSKMPEPGPDPKVKLGEPVKFELKNGLKVIVVQNNKLPRASASLTIDNAPRFEGDIAGVSSMMGSLLGRGTTNISKDDFNERVDYLGANVNFSSSGAFASSLSRYFDEILGLMADGVINSQFTQEEFDKEVKITLDGIKSNEKSVTAAARRVEDVLAYGIDHPFGEFVSKESVERITLDDVKNEYNTYYRPNNAYLIIVGDVNPKKIKKTVKKLFKNWTPGDIPKYEMPAVTNVDNTEINFVDMPNAVQSEIAVINTVDLTLGDEDYYSALLANTILGGGGTARLFQNLREDKGYTYGSYSRLSQSRYVGRFTATASVRNMVTDSSVVELLKEIDLIRNKKVSVEELENAKAKYIGNFVIGAQRPQTVARYALNKEIYNLPDDYYENYIENINAVTVDDVQNAAKKYMSSDNSRIVVTGKGFDVLPNLEKTGIPIKYYDKYANATEKPEYKIPLPADLDAAKVIDKYIEAIGGKEKIATIKTMMMVYEASVQGQKLQLTRKIADENKESSVIDAGGFVIQKQVFDGEKGYVMQQGKKTDLEGDRLKLAKEKKLPIEDIAYKTGKLDRIEPVDGKNAYVIIYDNNEIFYDVESGLKVKSVNVTQGPQGEVKVPTTYSDYKGVEGILIPGNIGISAGRMTLNFILKEAKLNEGVSDKDFE
jgi:predicted Zn-dependent peptidase